MHTATAILKCDIANLKGEILFKNEIVKASVVLNIRDNEWEIETFEDDTDYYYNKPYNLFISKLAEREKKYNPAKKYMYSVILDEFSCVAIDDYDTDRSYNEFVLLVKSEDVENIEVDGSMFERCSSDAYKALREIEL